MAEQITKKLPCGHTITVGGGLKMKDFRRWVEAEKQGELGQVYPYLAKVVVAWDWTELDPSRAESYDELEIAEYRQVVQAVSEWLTAEATAKN